VTWPPDYSGEAAYLDSDEFAYHMSVDAGGPPACYSDHDEETP